MMMRKFVSAKHCIAFAAVAMLSLVADACTAFVVGKKASATGHGRESVHPEEVPGVAWPSCRTSNN